MSMLLILGVITLASTGLSAPGSHPPLKDREFKGQLSPDGAFKVHLTLLAPPVDPEPDRTLSGRQYVANESEERNSGEYVRVQPLQRVEPPPVDPYLIPVVVGTPRETPHSQNNPNKNVEASSKSNIVKPRLIDTPLGPVPAGSGLEGQYVPDNHEKGFDDGSDKAQPAPLRLVETPYGVAPAGSGLEGQYANDNKEKQYDDGSDKAEVVTPHLVDSPIGPVPAGSGLEGQYVADNLEKRFDDGSDKAESVSPRIVDSPFGPAPAGSGFEGQYVPDNLDKLYDDGSDKTPETLKGLYVPDNIEKLYDDGSDKATKASSDSVNSIYGRDGGESNFQGQQFASNRENEFDDGLYRPKGLEKSFDDGLYRPEELAKRFDDGLIKF